MYRSHSTCPHVPAVVVRLIGAGTLAAVLAVATIQAQVPGRNVNMVSGAEWPNGDPFLQRQNEPSIAASTRNPLHLLGGSNDYRTVDLPGLPDGSETGDAWLGLYKSQDGGQRWISSLLPGYPQDISAEGLASPLKGYQAAADPLVRAGVGGLFYYSGLVFDRGEGGRSGIFVSRFIDNNNREDRDAVAYLGASLVAQGTGGAFLDKPWMAVDIPRGLSRTCALPVQSSTSPAPPVSHGKRRHAGRWQWRDHVRPPRPTPDSQRIPAGTAYVVYTSITGTDENLRAEILLSRSFDCGVTWSPPIKVSRPQDKINQGATLAIDPRTGSVWVAWRRFAASSASDDDAVLVAQLPVGEGRFAPPGLVRKLLRRASREGFDLEGVFEHRRAKRPRLTNVAEFDQGTSEYSFRTNAYPTMAMDSSGRVYVAWAERGFGSERPDPVDGDARIVISSGGTGRAFSAPVAVDDGPHIDASGQPQPLRGHQIMPALTFAGGQLVLIYYDLRDTASQTFSKYISDLLTTNGLRQTLDVRMAIGTPGTPPAFAPSTKLSDYLMGYRNSTGTLEQLQVNPPNLPMFRQGTVPFIGDYMDVQPAPAFVTDGAGRWKYNTATATSLPVFHAVWTDNRDVRPPVSNDWTKYTPATLGGAAPGQSLFDPSKTVSVCEPGNAGSRNQNIYTTRVTAGLLVGSPGNSKPLSPTVQRGFVVFAQNTTAQTRAFRMDIVNQPPGGRASFEQFPLPPYSAGTPAPRTSIDMQIPPRSMASRTVYVTSTDAHGQVAVDVREIGSVGGALVVGGLDGLVWLNPDPDNPALQNPIDADPDGENPDVASAEVYNPDVENLVVDNPDIENPDVENPDIENPDVENVHVANPDIDNPSVGNPDIENPDIENPDIENPDIENPDIENGAIQDITWNVTNTGNTTAAFNVNLFLAQQSLPSGLRLQLIVHKSYTTPITSPNGCDLRFETRNVLVVNIPDPALITPGVGAVPDQNDPSAKNATLWLEPGGQGKLTLRVLDDDTSNNLIIVRDDGTSVSLDPAVVPNVGIVPGVSGQGVDLFDPLGAVEPPIVTPTGSNLFFLQQPAGGVEGGAFTPSVRVQVRDNASGVPLAGVMVTLTLGENPEGAVLSGATAVSGADGIATFSALRVSVAGTGYTLVATTAATGVTASAMSVPFDVAPAGPPTTVGNTNDSGPGSLRSAIEFANATVGVAETISFDIPGPGPHRIRLASRLPPITDPVIIDGRTQPGYDGLPGIAIDGTNTVTGEGASATGVPGFEYQAPGTTILGLAIVNFKGNGGAGIVIGAGANASAIADSLIGTDRDGTPGLGNRIGLSMAATLAVAGNSVVSGNESDGVVIAGGEGNRLHSSRIGTSPDGLRSLPNGGYGVKVTSAVGTVIEKNLIGIDPSGAALMGNSAGGVAVLAGSSLTGVLLNDIAGNAGAGVEIVDASDNTIALNRIWGNAGDGISMVGTAVRNKARDNGIFGNGGLAIDLGGNGITLNDAGDADSGPNLRQNFPDLANARNVPASSTAVDFSTQGFAEGIYWLRFFSSATCDPSGHGQGERAVGAVNEIAGGTAGTVVLQEAVPVGHVITAIAYDMHGNTSEYSACVVVTTP